MSDDTQQILKNIAQLFESQSFAVLSTQKNDQPYSSLVAFAVNSDLNYFYFLTPNTTRKYDNLKTNPKVCILVNDSQNQADDVYNAVSVTGTGVAQIIDKSIEQKALDLYEELLAKIPDFRIDRFMDDSDSRDCEFLIAEAYQQSGKLLEAEFIYASLLEKEDKKPYFHHFAQEIKDLLKGIYIKKINNADNSKNISSNLQKLIKLGLSNYDIAWAYKKSAKAYYRINDYENAMDSLSLAFKTNPSLPGAKKISKKLGFID